MAGRTIEDGLPPLQGRQDGICILKAAIEVHQQSELSGLTRRYLNSFINVLAKPLARSIPVNRSTGSESGHRY